jgi:hypothetical protein
MLTNYFKLQIFDQIKSDKKNSQLKLRQTQTQTQTVNNPNSIVFPFLHLKVAQ